MKLIKNISAIVMTLAIAQVILPVSAEKHTVSASETILSEETVSFYNIWKHNYLVQDNYVTDETQYYVYYSEEKYNGGDQSVPVTVSEAHGYGMLIMASMAEYDKNAKEYFDGMYRYFKAHPSDIGSYLMSWQQCDNGTALIDGANEGSITGGTCDSATDGDMDIAYALLMADSIWGSDGKIDYYSEAVAIINDIMKYDVNHEYWTLTLGDWVSECDKTEKYYSATRCSDFIVQYMPVFAEVSGNDDWLKVYDTTYEIINGMVDEYKTGMLPDFVIRNSSGKYVPAPANFLESENDGNYYYNSCRVPWRISMDYLINGNKDALDFANAVDKFMMNASKGDPWEIMSGYTPSGDAIEDYNDLCFVAPLLISAKCDNNIQWHDEIRDVVINYGDDVYYGDTIKMLCLIVDDGGWIVPDITKETIKGDVNNDGKFNITDLVIMQKWLIGVGGLPNNLKAGNLHDDEYIDVLDVCLMRRYLINEK